MKTSLINILTLTRILFAILISLLLILEYGYVFAITMFFLAAVSDFFDGYLARKYNATSQIGEILDQLQIRCWLFNNFERKSSSSLLAFRLIISRENVDKCPERL